MKPAVFVSYARKSSSEAVKDLTCALSSAHITSFIDTKQIEPGHEFPAALTAAIEASPVFLAILDPEYTRSWYCIRELACALRSYLSAVEEDAGPDTELFRAGMKSVRRIVVVMSPTAGEDDMIMFPPHIQRRNWPRLDEREMLLGILKARLESSLDRSEGHDDDGGDYKTFNPLTRKTSHLGNVFPTHYIPRRLGPNYVGRWAQLWLMDFNLRFLSRSTRNSQCPPIVIEGSAGSGKSTLMSEYIGTFGDYFRGGIFWIDCGRDTEVIARQWADVLIEASKRSGLPDKVSWPTFLDAAAPTLFIADNVSEVIAAGGFASLHEILPVLGMSNVIITTRQSVSLSDENLLKIRLNGLRTDHALTILARELNKVSQPERVLLSRVARAIGGLPLALSLLNALLRAKAQSIDGLAAEILGSESFKGLESAAEALQTELPNFPITHLTLALQGAFDGLPGPAQRAALAISCLGSGAVHPRISSELRKSLLTKQAETTLRNRFFLHDTEYEIVKYHPVICSFLRSTCAARLSFLDWVSVAITFRVIANAATEAKFLYGILTDNLASFLAFGISERAHNTRSSRIISFAILKELRPMATVWPLLSRTMSTDGHFKASEKEMREFAEKSLRNAEATKVMDDVPMGFWLCEPLSAEVATETAEAIRLIDAQGVEFDDKTSQLGMKTIRLQVSIALEDKDVARHLLGLNDMVQREAKLQTGEVVSYLIDVIDQMLPSPGRRSSALEDALIKLRGGAPLNSWHRTLRFLRGIPMLASRLLKN